MCILFNAGCGCKSKTILEIDENIASMLEYMSISNCYINKLCAEIDVEHISKYQINDVDIEEYINNEIQLYGHFEENTNGKTVKNTDWAEISYNIYDNYNNIICSNDSQYININDEKTNYIFKSLIGHDVGEMLKIDLEQCSYEIVIKKRGEWINAKFNKDFVINNTNFKNIDDYVENIKETLEYQNQKIIYNDFKSDVLKQFINKSDFSINSNIATNYAMDVIKEYENEALLYNMTLEAYYKINLDLSEREFYEKCYTEAVETIKGYLVIGALAKENNIVVTETEIIENYGEKILEVKEEKIYAIYYILSDKIFEKYNK